VKRFEQLLGEFVPGDSVESAARTGGTSVDSTRKQGRDLSDHSSNQLSGFNGFRYGNLPRRSRRDRRVGNKSGQATKGVWRMSRRQKAKKGVEGCDKLGGSVKQELIPRFPNDRAMNT
jgi:hypothetical protein